MRGSIYPYSASARYAGSNHSELGAGADRRSFQAAHMRYYIERVRQGDDGIADQLSGAMPRYPSTSIDLDYRAAVNGSVARLSPTPGGEHGQMLDYQDGWRFRADGHLIVALALKLPNLGIVQRTLVKQRNHVDSTSVLALQAPVLALHKKKLRSGSPALGSSPSLK